MISEQQDLERPKRLLSLDGGGIRGLIAVEVLMALEKILCPPNGKWNCLADYFDFISGTSTGSILATGLALGMRAEEIKNFYKEYGFQIFQKRNIFAQLWSRYDGKPLEKALQKVFDQETLGSNKLKTRLMIVAKNASEGKTWFFTNDKNNKYFETNSKIPLWHLVRASSAAPVFFPPHEIDLGNNRKEEFIDGGMSMFNNPSYQLFQEVTNPSYGIGWKTGVEQLLIVSIGTGYSTPVIALGQAKTYTALQWAPYAVGILMEDANLQQNVLMKSLGKQYKKQKNKKKVEETPEVELVLENLEKSTEKQFSYCRYTTSFTKKRFEELGLPANFYPEDFAEMDCVDKMEQLSKIGEKIAEEQVSEDCFKKFWD
jgi:uncharacterized protein